MISGLTLQILIAGSLMPDFLVYEDHDRKYSRGTSKEAVARRLEIIEKRESGAALNSEDHPEEPTFYQKFLDAFRPHLLKDWRVQCLNGACFLVGFILAVMSSFNESILAVDYGLSLANRTALVAAGGAASMMGRLSVGCISKTRIIPRWWMWCLCGFSEGLSIALLGLLPSAGIGGAGFSQILYGYTLGFIFTMHAVALLDIFPSQDFGAVYAFNAFSMMLSSLVAPVFAGLFLFSAFH